MAEHYVLTNGEIVRIVPPPFIEARQLYLNAVNPPIRPLDVPYISLRWTDKGLADQPNGYGGTGVYLSSIVNALNFKAYELEGIDQFPWRPDPGDLVFRTGVPRQERVEALAKLLQQHTGKTVRFRSEKRIRPCIIVNGERRAELERPMVSPYGSCRRHRTRNPSSRGHIIETYRPDSRWLAMIWITSPDFLDHQYFESLQPTRF